jgi:hypothetical protein
VPHEFGACAMEQHVCIALLGQFGGDRRQIRLVPDQ